MANAIHMQAAIIVIQADRFSLQTSRRGVAWPGLA